MSANRPQKIFCIGRNKTGTTSVGEALRQAGYCVAPQEPAELMLDSWARRDFKEIVEFSKKYEAFQDIPYSLPYTYQIMDYVFPESKFILTVRDSSEQWFESLVRYHTKIVAKNSPPTSNDLKGFPYIYGGWLWKAEQCVYGIDEERLYDKSTYIRHYEEYNRQVIEYFRPNPDRLLELNLSSSKACEDLNKFLGGKQIKSIPHLNRSA
jgi:hypothetical protein